MYCISHVRSPLATFHLRNRRHTFNSINQYITSIRRVFLHAIRILSRAMTFIYIRVFRTSPRYSQLLLLLFKSRCHSNLHVSLQFTTRIKQHINGRTIHVSVHSRIIRQTTTPINFTFLFTLLLLWLLTLFFLLWFSFTR